MDPIRIYSPEGAVGRPTRALAASPAVLTGLRLGILDNGKPNAAPLMERMGEQLAQRMNLELVGVFRKGSAATPCAEPLLVEIAESCDLVLTGSAD